MAEGGGQWAGPTQTAVLSLAKELGIETFKTHTKGKTVVVVGGTRLTAAADERDESEDLRRTKEKLDAMAKEVPLATPWTAKNGKEWDALTVADWLKANAKEKSTREEIALEIETELGPAAGTSLLWYLFYVHSAGGIRALNVEAQELRFKGGSQSLSKKMAAEMGDDVFLSSPVKKIDDTGTERVEVESKGVRVSARRVVVAMMPADTCRIEFTPALPAARMKLAKGWKGEQAFKVNVVYAKAFWREDGLSGLAVKGDRGPVGVTFGTIHHRMERPGFWLGSSTRQRSSEAMRRAAVRRILDDLVALFGKGAKEPPKYFENDWSAEEWTRWMRIASARLGS